MVMVWLPPPTGRLDGQILVMVGVTLTYRQVHSNALRLPVTAAPEATMVIFPV